MTLLWKTPGYFPERAQAHTSTVTNLGVAFLPFSVAALRAREENKEPTFCAEKRASRRHCEHIPGKVPTSLIGFAGQALFLALASVTSSPPFLVAYLSISIGLGGICWAGFSVNHLDLAPQFAGHLMGISNTLATLPGMLCPLIVGYVVPTGTTVQWNIIFYSTAVIYALGAAFFWKFASGDLQPWAGEQAPFIGELH
ncbi:unnamed protein product [Heligmosomoides polygyrus]|uniref:MFS domain-containing protein n=1 Tax=Heligmosomoides polygyrus TaxID=6339 RepID=A0A183FHT2_HELPZ|nr:unnamed protein product [Heligmosomoides polygyrus]